MLLQLIRKEKNKTITETINFKEEGFMFRIVDEFAGGNLYHILNESDFQQICKIKRKERSESEAKRKAEAEEVKGKIWKELNERSDRLFEIERDMPDFERWKSGIKGKNFIQQVFTLWNMRKCQ